MSQTAAILAADVARYSRLMGADEEGTLERLKALRRERSGIESCAGLAICNRFPFPDSPAQCGRG